MILLSYGTRPEYIKIKPLIVELNKNNIEYKILFTGQQINIGEFEYDWILNINDKPNRLDSIVGSITNQLWECYNFFNFTHVLIQGDTTSAFAVALSAFHHKIKIIHLEAGLRTYDKENPYPEETNRRLISQITDIHLCPTEHSYFNLINENVGGEKYIVGNTVIDNLLEYKNDCEYTNKILITMHRRENHYWLDKWFIEFNKLAKEFPQLEFILPIHPNPNVQKHRHLLYYVKVIDPLSYDQMLKLLIKTKLVITDSGGLQEECSFFNKKCLTCRKITERPEAITQSTFIVNNPDDLIKIFYKHITDYEINYDCPFGDGHSAEKIIKIFKQIL